MNAPSLVAPSVILWITLLNPRFAHAGDGGPLIVPEGALWSVLVLLVVLSLFFGVLSKEAETSDKEDRRIAAMGTPSDSETGMFLERYLAWFLQCLRSFSPMYVFKAMRPRTEWRCVAEAYAVLITITVMPALLFICERTDPPRYSLCAIVSYFTILGFGESFAMVMIPAADGTLGLASARRAVILLLMNYLTIDIGFAVLYYQLGCVGTTDQLNHAAVPVRGAINHLYFSTVTITTVGYGDMFPMGPSGKILAGLQALGGLSLLVVILALLVSEMGSESEKEKYRKQRARPGSTP